MSAILAAPVVMVLGLSSAAISVFALARSLANADVLDYAGALEAGAEAQPGYIAEFTRVHQLDAPDSDCGDPVTRSRLTLALANYQAAQASKNTERIDSSLRNAVDAAQLRLECNPLDGNAWLQIARLKSLAEGPTPEVVEELRMSYLTAPGESWVLGPRLDLATALVFAGIANIDLEYTADLRRFVEFEPPGRIGEIYVTHDGLVVQHMRPIIDMQSDGRRKAIIAEIDRLGVDYAKR